VSARPILYLVPDLLGSPGGIARYCQMVCHAMLNGGFKLDVVALWDHSEAGAEAAHRFPAMSYQPCAGSRAGFVQKATLTALRQRPHLIMVGHAHFAPLGWALARLTGARVVTFLYGIEAWEPLSSARRYALQRMDQLVAISQHTARQAVDSNDLPASALRILYNCLDPQFEQPVNRNLTAPPSLLTVARINQAERYKGHDVVIRALPEILRHFPDLIYDIVGDGAGRPALEQLAQQVGVAPAVRFHGRVSDERLRQFYANASIFIMPSTHEGFGFVFAEAMAYGVPAIGGNVDATPEVIVDGETGYCIDPTSTEEIARTVTRLLSDDMLWQRLGTQAARHVREQFGYARFQQQLHTYLGEVVPAFWTSLASS